MEYREEQAVAALSGLVKAHWTLDCDGHAHETVDHVATPDGCIELIWRLNGRSWWQDEQPVAFVAGIITQPATLRLSGDSRFVGLRLWPWAWHALIGGNAHPPVDGWSPMPGALAALSDPAVAGARLRSFAHLAVMGEAVIAARRVADLASSTGRPHRWLQRWFDRHVGLPPRTYLRLLRFQEALAGLQTDNETLADHAAAHGFADQPHMAREFRAMTGMPASSARSRAKGPFV